LPRCESEECQSAEVKIERLTVGIQTRHGRIQNSEQEQLERQRFAERQRGAP
jgi:hypothetical protein